MNILFVCTGNTCRSPMAEILGNSKGGHSCSSAGIFATNGSLASPFAVQACQERNLNLKPHRARLLSPAMMHSADLVLTMTDDHKRWIEGHYGAHPGLFTLGEYADVSGLSEVTDPFGGSITDYRRTLTQLKTLLDAAWRRMQ